MAFKRVKITSYILQGGGREDVKIVNAKSFSQLLAQICQLLQALLNLLLSLSDVLGYSSFVFPDARCTLCLVEFHLQCEEYQSVITVFINT